MTQTQVKTRRIFPGNFVGNADKRHVPVFGVPSSSDDMSSIGHLYLHMEKATLRIKPATESTATKQRT